MRQLHTYTARIHCAESGHLWQAWGAWRDALGEATFVHCTRCERREKLSPQEARDWRARMDCQASDALDQFGHG
jgi:hypothetical protein